MVKIRSERISLVFDSIREEKYDLNAIVVAMNKSNQTQRTYRFSFGPWNINTGEDPFGPEVRNEISITAKSQGKLASVHLNDQNGLKFDQDKAFGSANLRAAFNQVRVLEQNNYGSNGEFVGLDVKAMRTQKGDGVMDHLLNSRKTFLHLVDKVRSIGQQKEANFIEERDYEGLDSYILSHLMGVV